MTKEKFYLSLDNEEEFTGDESGIGEKEEEGEEEGEREEDKDEDEDEDEGNDDGFLDEEPEEN